MALIPTTLGEENTIKVVTAYSSSDTPTLAINAVNVVGGAVTTNNFKATDKAEFVGFTTFSNSVWIRDNLAVSGLSTFFGSVTFKGGTIGLGDSITDNIIFTGDVDSNIIPNLDNAFDLGSILQKWRNIYLNVGVGKTYGIAYFGADSQLVATATPSVGIQTTNLLLTVDENNVPVWTDSIDGGFY